MPLLIFQTIIALMLHFDIYRIAKLIDTDLKYTFSFLCTIQYCNYLAVCFNSDYVIVLDFFRKNIIIVQFRYKHLCSTKIAVHYFVYDNKVNSNNLPFPLGSLRI